MGRVAGALTALVGVGSFDFFFVPPEWSFHLSDTQYLFTFLLMLIVALVTGQVAMRLRADAASAVAGERHASAMASMAAELSVAARNEDIARVCANRIAPLMGSQVLLMLPGEDGRMTRGQVGDPGIAQWVLQEGLPAGCGTEILAGSDAIHLPLKTPLCTRGVLAIGPLDATVLDSERMGLLRAFQSLVALAIERVHFVDIAHQTQLHVEGERLRNALLSAVSHDLRTPLTAIRGMAGMLVESEAAKAIVHQADRMQWQIANLLDAARMQSEGVHLDLQWHALDELVGSALAATDFGTRQVMVDITRDMPLVKLDATLFGRVLANLFDNAAKYTPGDATLFVGATVLDSKLVVRVEDDGPGFSAGMDVNALFTEFTRGMRESSVPGVGLGLALSRRIIEAHGGEIRASGRVPHGARIDIILAMGEPPPIEMEWAS